MKINEKNIKIKGHTIHLDETALKMLKQNGNLVIYHKKLGNIFLKYDRRD